MTRKKNRTLNPSKSIFLILLMAVFLYPAFVTATWLKAVASNDDPRKITKVEDFNYRVVDDNKQPLKPLSEPIISVTFDDGWESSYTIGLPALQKYGLKSTHYILGDEFNSVGYISEAQARSLEQAGHEIASHTMTHPDLTKLGDEELAWQLGESRKLLGEKFKLTADFASPLGRADDRTIQYISDNYRSNRNTASDPTSLDDSDINTSANFNRYNINAYTVRKTTTLEDIKKLIEYNEQNNGWLVITYHQLGTKDDYYGVTKDDFEQQLKLISLSRSKVKPVSHVLDILIPENKVTF